MNNITTTISFSIFSNKGIYALLLGSGISKNSGIPTGWDIVIDLIKKLAEINKENCEPNPEKWFESKYGQEPNYSTILSKLVKSPSERVNFLKPYFEPTEEELNQGLKQPTETHKQIASLIKNGYIKVVITTNFDRLLEKALMAVGIEPIVIRHPDDIDGAIPLVHTDFVLIKINGDYLDSRFLNTEEELVNYDKRVQEYILRVVNEFGIISCGWSAKWDIGLVNVLKQSENFRYFSYWSHLGQCENELKEIAKRRKGQTVQIESSDIFFRELADNINSLEKLDSNHPLTTDIAVARLKKYIVKDENKILLHDLIQEQLNATLKKIRVKDNISLYPNKKNVFPVISHYNQTFENLLHLIINGIYWSKTEHYYLFTNILESLSEPPNTTQGRFYEDTRKLLYFPSLLALYSIGLSALMHDNYDLINICFNIKIKDFDSDYADQLFLLDRVNSCMVESRIMNEIISQNDTTPISTYLANTLKPTFTRYFYNDKEFDDKFDVFEYLLSLNYMHLLVEKYGYDWAPWGQYQRRRFRGLRGQQYILNDFIKESELMKEEWPPLKAGMFNGSYAVFENVREKLDEFLKKIHI
jgi:hypothetical protein